MSDLIELAREASAIKYRHHLAHIPMILERLANELVRLTAENESLRAECGIRQIAGYNKGREELTADNAALRADAERYQFLRAQLPFVCVEWDNFGFSKRAENSMQIGFRYFGSFFPQPGCLSLVWTDDSLGQIDTAIDSARAKESGDGSQ